MGKPHKNGLKKREVNVQWTGAEQKWARMYCTFLSLQYSQLIALEEQINSKISTAGSGTDVGYWESLLQQLKAHMARVKEKS